MVTKSWSQLAEDCPIDIERIIIYSKECESYIPVKVTLDNLNESKELVFNARASFNSALVALMQILYDREILKTTEDKIMYAWLTDNLGRYMKRLDDEEFNTVVKNDSPQSDSLVGISRISSYSKSLKSSVDSVLYESLLKATKEYKSFKVTENIKREPRTFLYIFFQVIQVTLSVLGGLTRETGGINKRGTIQSIPTSWQSLIMPTGQGLIKDGWKEENKGLNLDLFGEEPLDEEEGEDENV